MNPEMAANSIAIIDRYFARLKRVPGMRGASLQYLINSKRFEREPQLRVTGTE